MDNVLKGLLLSVGIILTCFVVGIGFYVAREAKSTAMVSADQLSDFRKDLKDNSITQFDGVMVRGSDVVNLIKRELGSFEREEEAEIYITVITNILEATYSNSDYFKEIKDFSNIRYINPLKSFQGEIVKDANDVIIGIIFEQE